MEIEYIKANGEYYFPSKEVDLKYTSVGKPIQCHIKKLWFGRWQIDYFEWILGESYCNTDMVKPNSRIVLHNLGIEQIKYIKRKN